MVAGLGYLFVYDCPACLLGPKDKEEARQSKSFADDEERVRTPKDYWLWGIPWLKTFVTGYFFELFFVFLIIVNCGTMIAQIELIGAKLAYEVGLQTDPVNTLDEFFFYVELGFGLAFTFEIVLKFIAFPGFVEGDSLSWDKPSFWERFLQFFPGDQPLSKVRSMWLLAAAVELDGSFCRPHLDY